MPGVIYRITLPEISIIFINETIRDVCGYTDAEILSGSVRWIDLVHEEDLPRLLKCLEPDHNNPLFSIEYRIWHKTGEIRWVLNRGITCWVDGQPKWRDGIILDITKSKATESELETRRNELSNLVNSLEDMVFEIDALGRFRNFYAKDRSMLILPAEKFLNKTIPEAFDGLPSYALLFQSAYQKTVTEKENQEIEFTYRKGDMIRAFRARFIFLFKPGTVSVMVSDITRQRNAEFALKQSEEILRRTSQAANIGGWEIDVERRTIQWSDEIYKIREVEKSGTSTLDDAFNYYGPEVRPLIEKIIEDGITSGIPWDIELPFVTAKGNKKWIRDVGIPEMENGKCRVLRGVLQDITEKKNAELALRRREQELELAISGGDLGTWDLFVTTQTVNVSERLARMLGYSPLELSSFDFMWKEIVHPEDRIYVVEEIYAHLDGATKFYETEHRLRHKDGHWVWILDKGKIVEKDEQGKPIRVSGTYLDVTERKKVEVENRNLQFELEEFKEAVNAATIVSIADRNGVIKFANKKFEEISLYRVEELVGQNHNIINSGYHPKNFWGTMWKTISKGNIWRAEVKNKRKDGTFYWVDTFIIPLRNIDNEIVEYLSIRNNITDKKENEINIQDALRKAEESDKLKSAFLANISHEIRTPMNGIMGITELLERPNLTEQKKAEFLRLMYERSHHLLSVVNNILDISKLEARQVTPVHVVGNINEVFERLILTFGGENHLVKRKEITLRVVNRLTPRQNVIMADFIRLYQILHNLIANAIKFTVEGEVEFGCMLQNPEQLLFWVKDTGIGIQEHNIDNIFKPFQQASESTHEEFGGSGLGLAISKGLVEMWGGRIWVESKVGRGSVFYFTMPFQEVNTKNE